MFFQSISRSALDARLDDFERLIRRSEKRIIATLHERFDIAMSELQTQIDRLKAGLSANTSATQGVVDLMTKFAADVRDAADDPDEVRAIADAYDNNTAALVAALAQGTPVASEPVPNGPSDGVVGGDTGSAGGDAGAGAGDAGAGTSEGTDTGSAGDTSGDTSGSTDETNR